MTEYTYLVCKLSWWIHIKIIAEAVKYSEDEHSKNTFKVCDKLQVKFADKPINSNEKFCDDDMPYLIDGLRMVSEKIVKGSEFSDTLIVVHSVQFNPCDFQEEGLTAAIAEWTAVYFGFEKPIFDVSFDKKNNRYIYTF